MRTRLEYRPPDATANPYLAISALLMAGLDGIENKIDPRQEGFGPFDKNVFDTSGEVPFKFLPQHLDGALDNLETDYDYLLKGDVFSKSLIDQWIAIKREEIRSIATMPNPFEYKLYFDL